jgi:hypothetical protein
LSLGGQSQKRIELGIAGATSPPNLKGVSTGEFEEALAALLGNDAGGLSATTIGRLKEAWSEEHARFARA